MKKYVLIVFSLMFLLFFTASQAEAAKKRVFGKNIVTTSANKSNFSVTAKITGWKQYLNLNFRGVASTQGVAYELVYTSNGIDQAAGGGVAPDANNVSRTLFFGTCSHGACVAHKNISNVRLRISYTTLSGQSVVKNYKVKY